MLCFNYKHFSRLLIVCGALLGACSKGEYFTYRNGIAEGTTFSLVYESPSGQRYEDEVYQLLRDFEKSLSIYDSTSLISRINRNEPNVAVDDYFRTVFQKAVEVNSASDGTFDITVAPLVNLWGFGFTSDSPNMDSAKIDSLMQYVGMSKVRIEGNRVVKASQGVMLDVNAIAKGFSSDLVAKLLYDKGCRNFLVEIGGEIVARGVNAKGKPWRVGIDKPADDNLIPGMEGFKAIISLDNKALATSGNYRKFHVIDGVKYAHTIDVKTGYPVHYNLLSATIVADDCMTADAWATTCMASGLDKSLALLKQHPELSAFLIFSNTKGEYETFISESLKSSIINVE